MKQKRINLSTRGRQKLWASLLPVMPPGIQTGWRTALWCPQLDPGHFHLSTFTNPGTTSPDGRDVLRWDRAGYTAPLPESSPSGWISFLFFFFLFFFLFFFSFFFLFKLFSFLSPLFFFFLVIKYTFIKRSLEAEPGNTQTTLKYKRAFPRAGAGSPAIGVLWTNRGGFKFPFFLLFFFFLHFPIF